jgi:hypothetical protein
MRAVHRERHLQHIFYCCMMSQGAWRVPLLHMYGPLPSNGWLSSSTVLALSKYAAIPSCTWENPKWLLDLTFPNQNFVVYFLSPPVLDVLPIYHPYRIWGEVENMKHFVMQLLCPPVTPISFVNPVYKHCQQKVNIKIIYSFTCNFVDFLGVILACFRSAFHVNCLTPSAWIRIWKTLAVT